MRRFAVDPHEIGMMTDESGPYILYADHAAELSRLSQQCSRYRMALEQIASGEGHYGAQAGEYKQIARKALADGDSK